MVDDLRYAVRSLLSSRGFTVVALLVIALGVGATTPIFSIVDAVALRALPYPDSDRLVMVRGADYPQTSRVLAMSVRNYADWRERQRFFDGFAGVRFGGGTVPDGAGSEVEVRVARVSGDFFHVLRQVPQFGRALGGDDEAARSRVAVVSHGFWQRVFGGDPANFGRAIRIDGVAYDIVGVASDGFAFPAGSAQPADVFVPLVIAPAERARPRGGPRLMVIARLPDGAGDGEAQAAMDTVALDLRRNHPDWEAGAWVVSYRDYVAGPALKWMRLLLWGVVLVFLIMCANVANLLLARGSGRTREVGVRAALGASRWRIARQLMLESVLLAAAGTAAGVLLGWWGLELFRASLPANVPRAAEVALNWRLLGIAGAAAIATGLMFGLAPAILSSRVDLSSALKSGGAGAASAAGARLRSLLIVAEMAVALVLLVGALLFSASFLKVTSIPLGVDYRNVVTTNLQGPQRSMSRRGDPWAESNRLHDLTARLVERLRAVPGVEDVAGSSSAPFSGGKSSFGFDLPGRPGFAWSRADGMVTMKIVSPNYHELLRIPLLRGRLLRETDSRGAPGVALVSEEAARMIWPGEDPIGQRIDMQKMYTVVGVVADVRMGGPEEAPWPDVYVPLTQGVGTYASTLLVRTLLPADDMLPSLRAAVQQVDPSQRLTEATTLESFLDRRLAQRRFNMLVVGAFGLIGVLIAAIGLYGVMAYLVTQRTHEIGIRMALGASRGRVLQLVLSRAALLAGAGLAIGGAGVWYFSSVVRSFLFELEPLDAQILAAAVTVMALTALVASAIPARRAASVDPLIALRHD